MCSFIFNHWHVIRCGCFCGHLMRFKSIYCLWFERHCHIEHIFVPAIDDVSCQPPLLYSSDSEQLTTGERSRENVFKIFYYCKLLALPFDVLQFTTPNQPSFSWPSRVSTMKPHSITAQNIRDSSGPNHFDSRSFCTATELPNCLMWLLLLLLLWLWLMKLLLDVHNLIWLITLFRRGFWSIVALILVNVCLCMLKNLGLLCGFGKMIQTFFFYFREMCEVSVTLSSGYLEVLWFSLYRVERMNGNSARGYLND